MTDINNKTKRKIIKNNWLSLSWKIRTLFIIITKEISDKEWDLLSTIRNYKRASPNGSRMMKREIMALLDELMTSEEDEEDDENKNKEMNQ